MGQSGPGCLGPLSIMGVYGGPGHLGPLPGWGVPDTWVPFLVWGVYEAGRIPDAWVPFPFRGV